MSSDEALRKQLVDSIRHAHAHIMFEDTVKGFPLEKAGVRPDGLPHSGWELLEHLRIAQHDIYTFSVSADAYHEVKWPDDYWPALPEPPDAGAWTASVQQYLIDQRAFCDLLMDPSRDLFAPFVWGQGQTLLREALLILDHNSYHVGQLLLVKKALTTP
ncbi:MAG: DinB family protein [Bryobacteraceae bacterium]|nr:DinB family protein [Bryobacteraceae bacterium]